MRFRLRARFGRLRRYHKVVGVLGVAIAVVSIVFVVFTMRWDFMISCHDRMVAIAAGAVYVASDMQPISSPPLEFDFYRRSSPEWVWLPSSSIYFPFTSGPPPPPPYRQTKIPLWMFFALGLGLAAPAMLSMRRMRFGNLCPACDYDRTGLPDDTPCPECGKSR